MVIAPTCPNVSLNPEARFGYMDGRSICIMSFSRWQKLMARITLNTVAPADNGAATPSGASGASIFSFFIESRYDTTATENARTPSWQPVDSSMQSLPEGRNCHDRFETQILMGSFAMKIVAIVSSAVLLLSIAGSALPQQGAAVSVERCRSDLASWTRDFSYVDTAREDQLLTFDELTRRIDEAKGCRVLDVREPY